MTYWGKNDITVIKGQELFGTIPTIDDSSHFLVTTALLKKKNKQTNERTNKQTYKSSIKCNTSN